MTATFRDSSGVVTGVNVTSIIVPVPAAVLEGDLMIAIINLGPQVSTGVPAGWAHVVGSPHQTIGGFLNNDLIVMTRVADAGDEVGANYTWNRALQFSPIGGVIIAYSDADPVLDYLSITGHDVGHSNGDPEYIDTDIAAEIQLTAVALTGEWSLGPSSIIIASPGFTEREDVVFIGNGGHLQVQDRLSPGPGAFSEPISYSLAGAPPGTHSILTLGIGNAPPVYAEIEIIDLDPSGPAAIPVSSAVSFSLVGPANFVTVGVSLLYRSDPNRYIVYETDGFTAPYTAGSSVAGIGTNQVDFTLAEFGSWRDRVASITVFGIDAAGTVFSLEAIE